MSEKSEVRTILDAVAGFNDSINGFKDSIIITMRTEMKELKIELKDYFTNEINRTNQDVKELKTKVEIVKKEAESSKLLIHNQKNKLAFVISIAVFFSTLIIGVVQHFVFKIIG